MGHLRASFEALGEREFRLLWSGSLLATTAFMTTFILVPIVAYEITGSYAASGLAQAGMVSQLIFGPFGGVIADRYKKKPLVLGSQIIPCAIIVVTGILIVADAITIPMLFASTFLMGATFSLMGPARQSWVVELVPPRLLPNAVALQNMSINVAAVLGPLAASILVLSMGLNSGILYLLVAALFVVVIPLTVMIRGSGAATPKEQRKAVFSEMAAGLSYITSRPQLRSLWLLFIVVVVTGFALQTLIPGLLSQEFNRSEQEATLIATIWGVTALPINIVLAGMVGGRFAWPLLFLSSASLAGGIWLTAAAPNFAVLLIVSGVAGGARSAVMLLNQAILMANTRPEYFGRVMSWVFMAFGVQGLLAPVWGIVADSIGGRETLYVVGLALLAATVLMTLSRARTRHIAPEAGTAAASIAAEQPPEPEAPKREPLTAPSPAVSPLFAARLAPVVLMEGQKPR
ncbi:MAG: MFS transporter [Chloroflexi bacterium]|nr:MFS transporter [Chloroflexota bacterium]MCY3697043.1 MFS transporter [Chloroflexota bacterium]